MTCLMWLCLFNTHPYSTIIISIYWFVSNELPESIALQSASYEKHLSIFELSF